MNRKSYPHSKKGPRLGLCEFLIAAVLITFGASIVQSNFKSAEINPLNIVTRPDSNAIAYQTQPQSY